MRLVRSGAGSDAQLRTGGQSPDEERSADCPVDDAGEALTTDSQAECYANEYTVAVRRSAI